MAARFRGNLMELMRLTYFSCAFSIRWRRTLIFCLSEDQLESKLSESSALFVKSGVLGVCEYRNIERTTADTTGRIKPRKKISLFFLCFWKFLRTNVENIDGISIQRILYKFNWKTDKNRVFFDNFFIKVTAKANPMWLFELVKTIFALIN